MPELTLADVGPAVRAAWCLQTCDDADVADWSPANPARGQCGATALTVHDLLGGELLVAEVRHPDGSRQGYHHWNRLPGGVEVDLTSEQFAPGEVVQDQRAVRAAARAAAPVCRPVPAAARERVCRTRRPGLSLLGRCTVASAPTTAVRREAGVIPARSRHCEPRRASQTPRLPCPTTRGADPE